MPSEGFILWLTGLPGAGKTTLARQIAPILRERGCRVEVLDGEEVRGNLCSGLGFSREDRDTNVRRLGHVANLLARNGCVAVVAAISPYAAARREVRKRSQTAFVEVFVHAPLETVLERDPKGLYRKARAGELESFTGVDDPYEAPEHAEVLVDTSRGSIESAVQKILTYLVGRELVCG